MDNHRLLLPAAGCHDDDLIRATNDDAALSTLVLGTYTRSKAIDQLIHDFLTAGDGNPRTKQIVSIGAGSDTRYFLLKNGGMQPGNYFEIDFAEITAKKAQTIAKNKALSDTIGPFQLASGGTELHGADYHLLAGDLRTFATDLVAKLHLLNFSSTSPTLFLSECVLIYLAPSVSESILRAASSIITSGMFVVYEQINPHDAFGQTMLQNLRMRGIELLGWDKWPDIEAQKRRFRENGWSVAKAGDLNEYWDGLPQVEKDRIAKLEIFDEIEEWRLLSAHYCVSWGIKSAQ
ncbi:hypothetical protein PhCBS80983_g00721 [Powellomyces hirtus]|uniref:Leucine carboxyl methyltransferase 1 n=1 Tax=Powellomyces hirtus TaxID=109895 RepID=A0A507EDF9_9FUNG|nr:hypothetical protein PhCBS80983_g00721 [Powellomyces hirtus]